MEIVIGIFIFLLGLIFGSFISALSYRLPRNISINDGRSKCPKCKKKISWYDNIPLFSYLYLHGKCRSCKKKISLRYPFIEFSTGALFLLVWFVFNLCGTNLFAGSPFCIWKGMLGIYTIFLFFFVLIILISIFIIDYETKIIPDELVFIGFGLVFLVLVLINSDSFYLYILSGFIASLFLLILNLITKGRGMGLGDVKIALFLGELLGYPFFLIWLFLSFLTGAVTGIILILVGKTKFGKEISFGPFLVFSGLLVLFLGKVIITWMGF